MMSSQGRRGRAARRPFLEGPSRLEPRVLLSGLVFTVNSTSDSGPGTLRQAIQDANQAMPGPNSIVFAIGSGTQTIPLSTALPAIVTPVLIDGSTQPGFTSAPLIVIRGNGVKGDEVDLQAPGTTLQDLTIEDFGGDGVEILGGGNTVSGCVIWGNTGNGINLASPASAGQAAGSGNLIVGNGVGVDAARANVKANKLDGIEVATPANTIGGTGGAGNCVGGNLGDGIVLETAASGTAVEGNSVGVDPLGNHDLFNTFNGINVKSSHNTIDGAAQGAGNSITDNGADGIHVLGAENLVQGNRIGIDAISQRGNGARGVYITGPANTIGGVVLSPSGKTNLAGNIISRNGTNGVEVAQRGDGCLIEGNTIGSNRTGLVALGNFMAGIYVTFSAREVIIINNPNRTGPHDAVAGLGVAGAGSSTTAPDISSHCIFIPGMEIPSESSILWEIEKLLEFADLAP